MSFIQILIVVCTVINITCIFLSRRSTKKVRKNMDNIRQFRDEIVKGLSDMEKLAKKLRGNMHMIQMPSRFDITHDAEVLDVSTKADFSPRWEQITKKAHEDLEELMDKKVSKKDNSDKDKENNVEDK